MTSKRVQTSFKFAIIRVNSRPTYFSSWRGRHSYKKQKGDEFHHRPLLEASG
jgi:hypothetical protein